MYIYGKMFVTISKYEIINIIQEDTLAFKIVIITPYACGNANIIPCIVHKILMNNQKII